MPTGSKIATFAKVLVNGIICSMTVPNEDAVNSESVLFYPFPIYLIVSSWSFIFLIVHGAQKSEYAF